MRIWLARFLIALVFFFNLQCALFFWLTPQVYAPSYELSGDIGVAVIRGFAVLFLMWNVPYAVALWHPKIYSLSLWMVVVMQAIGVLGEMFIFLDLPAGHELLSAAIGRFIAFDSFGLFLLLLAVWMTRKS